MTDPDACSYCGESHPGDPRHEVPDVTPGERRPPQSVSLIFRDPVGNVILIATCQVGTRLDVGGGVPSHSMMIGWVDVVAPGDQLPDAPNTPGARREADEI
jgi:hypothetical protein